MAKNSQVVRMELTNINGDLVVWVERKGDLPGWKMERRSPHVLGTGVDFISWASVQRAVRAQRRLAGFVN
jgi:hypothetical protein